jgi:hypothetical protein
LEIEFLSIEEQEKAINAPFFDLLDRMMFISFINAVHRSTSVMLVVVVVVVSTRPLEQSLKCFSNKI